MAINEQSRHELYRRLEGAIGPDAAATLMEHLPPMGWADVATKRDLDVMEQRLRPGLRGDIHEAINSALVSQTRTISFGLIGSSLAVAALAFAAASIR